MTLHYHGTPITPREVLLRLAGSHFCVSFAVPQDVKVCHEIGQSVMLDNGAFSLWGRGEQPDWNTYYRWAEPWLAYRTSWAVIPDVIDGDLDDNKRLIKEWPFGDRGAPVWHMHEPIEWLIELCHNWPRVCIGSSGDYRTIGDRKWHLRMSETFDHITKDGQPIAWIHMLRGMSLSRFPYPFASLDSTDVARNHNRPWNDAVKMVRRWDAKQCPAIWRAPSKQMALHDLH